MGHQSDCTKHAFDEVHRVDVENDVVVEDNGDDGKQLLLELNDVSEALRVISAGSVDSNIIMLKYGGGHRMMMMMDDDDNDNDDNDDDDDDNDDDDPELEGKAQSNRFSFLLLTLFSLCLKAGHVPDQWKEAWQAPIYFLLTNTIQKAIAAST